MQLIIAEKPSLARAIVAAIDNNPVKEKEFFRCKNDVVVTWLLGHVLEQFGPDEYKEEWKRWDLALLPMIPAEWKLKEVGTAKAVIRNVKSLLKQAKEVVHAGDPDREGQLLVDEFLEFFGWKGKTSRLLLKDLTPETIRKALGEMKDNAGLQGLKNAALARQRADWVVGMNASRYFTIAARSVGHDGVLSIGRVQTPTLWLVVKRDMAIRDFKAVPYYLVQAKINLENPERGFSGTWQPDAERTPLDEEGRLVDRASAEALIDKVKGKQAEIAFYEKKERAESPPLPFRLSDLQAQANRQLGLTLKQTLDTVQGLYEKQLVSYPRSDCPYLPEALHEKAGEIIGTIMNTFPQFGAAKDMADVSRKGKAFDDKKVAEHYAITPTGKAPANLSDTELKVYELICVRYLLQFFPDHRYRAVTAEFVCESELFRATGRELVDMGWRGWRDAGGKDADREEDGELVFIPQVSVHETGTVESGFIQDKKTTPPKPHNDGTLVKAMSNIHQYVTDPEIRKRLREVDGIGTSATQYAILEKLLAKGLARREKKEIRSTEVGRVLIDALENGTSESRLLAAPDMTAIWEQEIGKIERGEASIDKFLAGVSGKISAVVNTPIDGSAFSALGKDAKKCFKCGKGILKKIKGKSGPFWGCQNPACKATFGDKDGEPQPKPKEKEGVCPACGGTARLRKGPYGAYWRCGACDQNFNDDGGVPMPKNAQNATAKKR
jgi:DNA topoisomerase-3